MKVQMTKLAVSDLEAIDTYVRYTNPSAATRMVLRVLEAIEYLSTYPSMGREGRVPKTKELVVSQTPFIVVYQIRQQIILILRILHGARKWP